MLRLKTVLSFVALSDPEHHLSIIDLGEPNAVNVYIGFCFPKVMLERSSNSLNY